MPPVNEFIRLRMDADGGRQLVDRLERRFDAKQIRDALMPAARTAKKAVRVEAPKREGRLMRSVKTKKLKKPAVAVVVDRKKALRISSKYPTGFPYVNSVISEKRRGAKADKFVERGWHRIESAARAEALTGLRQLAELRGIF